MANNILLLCYARTPKHKERRIISAMAKMSQSLKYNVTAKIYQV